MFGKALLTPYSSTKFYRLLIWDDICYNLFNIVLVLDGGGGMAIAWCADFPASRHLVIRMIVQPVTLQGNVVRLELLSEIHVVDLAQVGKDPSIWRYLPYGELTNNERMLGHVRLLLQRAAGGSDLPFAVIHQETNRAIGCSRYMEIEREHNKLEIGGTWYGVDYQRTKVNTESKYLLLEHAFEILGCIRVQFKTDARNKRSQVALERLNAVKEGVLRNHMILPSGEARDSVYYSVIASEWPNVKANLEKKLARTNS